MRFRSFLAAVDYYERKHGLSREKAVARAYRRCPKMCAKWMAQLTAEALAATQDRIDEMMAYDDPPVVDMADEDPVDASLAELDRAIAAELQRRAAGRMN